MILVGILFIGGGIAILLIGAQSDVLWAITLFIIGGFFLFVAGYTKQEKSKSVESRDMQQNQDESIEKRLDNLNDLKNRGIITEEEYEKQRKNIIDSI